MNQGSVELSPNVGGAPQGIAATANNGILTTAGNVFQLGEIVAAPQAATVLTANRYIHTGQFNFIITQTGLPGAAQPKSFVSMGSANNETFAFRDHVNTLANSLPIGNQTLVNLMCGANGSNVNCGIDVAGMYPSNFDGIKVSNNYVAVNAAARMMLSTNHGFMIFSLGNNINNVAPGAQINAYAANGLNIGNTNGVISFFTNSFNSERMRIWAGVGNVSIGLPYVDKGEKLQVQGNVLMQHLQTTNVSGTPPVITPNMAALGTGATAVILGNDTCGTIIINVGSNPDINIIKIATVTLNVPFYSPIRVFITPRRGYNNAIVNPSNLGNEAHDIISVMEDIGTLNKWDIYQNGITPMKPGQSFNFNYLCIDAR